MGVNDPYDPYGLAPVPPPLGDRGDVPSTRRRRRDLFDDESSHHADLEDKAALVQEQLASLRDLNLSYNPIPELPSTSAAGLKRLKDLDLRGLDGLEGVPVGLLRDTPLERIERRSTINQTRRGHGPDVWTGAARGRRIGRCSEADGR